MCCFSNSVESVSDTRIFARVEGSSQFLVYSMAFSALSELAMVLPLPVLQVNRAKALRFINLERYPEFFTDMWRGFHPPSRSLGAVAAAASSAKLPVFNVGAFEASFVPSISDFARLDERFQLDPSIWEALPVYGDFGFAVCKLKPTRSPQRIHPFALEFLTAEQDAIFFPTVHVHDREVHSSAAFDHTLFCQLHLVPDGWKASAGPASTFVDIARSEGVVAAERPCLYRRVSGMHVNEDIRVKIS